MRSIFLQYFKYANVFIYLLEDSSIITATYHLNGELLGTIAVLGPTRMEYAKAMSLLEYMNDNLTEVIRKYNW